MTLGKSITCLLIAAGMLASGVAQEVRAQANEKEIRWGTSRVGSSGHRTLTNLAQTLNKEVQGYEFTVQPTPGAIVSVKGYAIGDFEGYYGSDIAFYEFANNIRRFEGFKDQMKREPVQSFWTFTLEMGVGIHSDNVGKINSWGDLDGERVFTGPRPWDTRAALERAFEALGIEHDYLEVDIKTAGSLLEQGRFTGFGVYVNAETTPPPWLNEASLQTDWALLSPSASELERLESAGIAMVSVETSAFDKKKDYAKSAMMLPFFYGLHLGMDVPEEDMYGILRTVEANIDDIAASDKAFRQIKEDMPRMQRRGVEASIDLVKVHPGLARYMREKGVWDAKWDSRIAR
ncbi:TAXI family TRAP transporter solute-binding subunit [Thioalkalivibrio sp. HK1]|uniref:TAXI family TRAP transporter solute-binding subunit n=1 Tax=Thioalkalivibrio sp. HK1 TaxID=1469245 RepID=UPI0004706D0E|nr:TAXI family TRAP transporter solute-binding subunit [Thioalkalivibrio sp. HK1]